jgi:hypothetical protein
VVREQPQLRAQALTTLSHLKNLDGLARFVKPYLDDANPDVSNAARDIHNRAIAKDAADLIEHGEYPDYYMLRQLGLMDSRVALPTLLRTAISGPEFTREAAVNALRSHSANLINFYARQLKVSATPLELQHLSALQAHNPGRVDTGLSAQ